jgi:hypothetical protein
LTFKNIKTRGKTPKNDHNKNNDFQSKKVFSFEFCSVDGELDAFLPTGRTKRALEGSDIGSARGGLFHLPDEENFNFRPSQAQAKSMTGKP